MRQTTAYKDIEDALQPRPSSHYPSQKPNRRPPQKKVNHQTLPPPKNRAPFRGPWQAVRGGAISNLSAEGPGAPRRASHSSGPAAGTARGQLDGGATRLDPGGASGV